MGISKPSGNTVEFTYQSLLIFDTFTGKSIKLTIYSNLDLNFLEFDTKLIKFGKVWGLDLHN